MEVLSSKNMSDDETKKIEMILTKLKNNENSLSFLRPVNYRELGLPDYPKIIRKSMDIATVESKYKRKEYSSLAKIYDDLQLIWDNCKKFNMEGSTIYEQADKMENFTDQLYKANFNSIPKKSKIIFLNFLSEKNTNSNYNIYTM